MPRTGSPQIP